MIAVFAVEERGGMMFHGRRLSRDRRLIERILARSAGSRIWTDRNTASLFPDGTVCADDDFLIKAQSGDYCVIEDRPPSTVADGIEKIVLYKWNRAYPADLFFDLSLDDWQLESRLDFPGNSHETITEEVWIR